MYCHRRVCQHLETVKGSDRGQRWRKNRCFHQMIANFELCACRGRAPAPPRQRTGPRRWLREAVCTRAWMPRIARRSQSRTLVAAAARVCARCGCSPIFENAVELWRADLRSWGPGHCARASRRRRIAASTPHRMRSPQRWVDAHPAQTSSTSPPHAAKISRCTDIQQWSMPYIEHTDCPNTHQNNTYATPRLGSTRDCKTVTSHSVHIHIDT